MDTKKLRQKILDLAIHGKLVPQDPNDEPASVLLERIRAEKEKLIKEGKIKAPKKSKSAGDTSHYPKEGPWELPRGWVWCHLSDLASFAGGKTPSMDNKDFWKNGKHLWITSKDMKSRYLIDSQMKISDTAVREMTVFHPGTILMVNRSGILRRTLPLAILNAEATINQDIKAIVPYLLCISPYLYYAILSQESFILSEYKKAGTTVDNINFDKFISLLIPLPPQKEQDRIVSSINQYFAIIENIDSSQKELNTSLEAAKAKILDLAIRGKLVPQDPNEEPAIELLKRINPDFIPSDNLHYEGKLPSGWMLCCLEDVLDYEQPQAYIVESTDYSDDYKTPVLTPGKSFVLGYTNETSGICNSLPVIIFDDFTTESKYVDFPFKVKSSAMKILHARGEINLEYVAIFMSITRLVGDTHKRYWISEYSKIPIPIPPQNEQRRIVETVGKHFQTLDSIRKLLQD